MRLLIKAFGMASAAGRDPVETWARLKAGDTSQMMELHRVLPDEAATRFGFVPLTEAELVGDVTRCEAILKLLYSQIEDAVETAIKRYSPERVAVILGTSNSTLERFRLGGPYESMARPLELLREMCGAKGPAYAVSTACSSSGKTFADAQRLIENDVADAVVVGGVDGYSEIALNGFNSLEALSHNHTNPFAAGRDGINLGEGGALFLVERAPEQCDGVMVLGVGESSDAYHFTAPDPEGHGAECAMRLALEAAGVTAADVGYVNLHGTGTRYNDLMEAKAVAAVFGDSVPCSSTKFFTGHLLGAAGALEAAICALALEKREVLPPHPLRGEYDPEIARIRLADDDCAADGLKVAVSNSFAFGGSNACVALGRGI